LNVVLPRDSPISLYATYTVFDFGKRERGVKESNAQAEMAEMAVPLTKAKVTAAGQEQLFRTGTLAQNSVNCAPDGVRVPVVEASYQSDNPDVESAEAKIEQTCFGPNSNIVRHTPGEESYGWQMSGNEPILRQRSHNME